MVQYLKKQRVEDSARVKHYKKLKAEEGKVFTPEEQEAMRKALRSNPSIARILDKEKPNA